MSKVFTIAEGLENLGAIKIGGQGSVYKGRRTADVITAIKILPTPIFSQSEDDKHYRDFISEVKKLQRVAEEPNPNVVKILSYGISETSGFPFIEMEYIDGPDLAGLLKPPYDPVFTIKEIIRVAEQLSAALAHCHKLDVKHGDIKSNNVKFNKHTGNYVLLDFGLAILSNEERRTSKRQAGAIEFMAPEQNEGKMFFETDVYSIGVVLFELLAGQVPFPLDGNSVIARNKVMMAHMEETPPDVLSLRASMLPADWSAERKAMEMEIPGWLVSMIYKCLEKRPEDRFANGTVLHDFVLHHKANRREADCVATREDKKEQPVAAQRDHELQALRNLAARQEEELKMLLQNGPAKEKEHRRRNTVSKSLFSAVLVALLLVSALGIYALFFHRPVVGAANVGESKHTAHDTLSALSGLSTTVASENNSNARQPATEDQKNRMPGTNKAAKKTTDENDKLPAQAAPVDAGKKGAAVVLANEGAEAKAEKEGGSFDYFSRYKVRGKAYIHTQPDESTKRPAFITHWNNAVLTPLDEQNGFVYIIFTNHEGETSRGWLLKTDLIKVK